MKRERHGHVAAIVLVVLIIGCFVFACILAVWLGSRRSETAPASNVAAPGHAYASLSPSTGGSSLGEVLFSLFGLGKFGRRLLAAGGLISQFFRGVGEAVSEVANAADSALAERSAERDREQALTNIERQQRIVENDQRIVLNNLKLASKISKLDSRSDGET